MQETDVIWKKHYCRLSSDVIIDQDEEPETSKLKVSVEPWIAALLQSDHLSLLLGSGFSTAISYLAGVPPAGMAGSYPDSIPLKGNLEKAANESAIRMKRGTANIEDRIRTATLVLQGLEITDSEEKHTSDLKESLNKMLSDFYTSLITMENRVLNASDEKREQALEKLLSFLLSFSHRPLSRERLHLFTTNYDRFIEYGADLAGLHLLDRFVGSLEPIFRSSRLEVDMHYNPPGIRGEPRYLEGVVRLTKLHGSLDWRSRSDGTVYKVGIPFGTDNLGSHQLPADPLSHLIIYPNSLKDRETAEYPYVDLHRDYAASLCRPNTVLVTYGYGFGDDHINRVIRDMLTIPSTHLLIISFGDEDGRISEFSKAAYRPSQISLMIGPHFGYLATLVENYLPQPSSEIIKGRVAEIQKKRPTAASDVSHDVDTTSSPPLQ